MAFDFKLRDRLASGVQRLRDKTDLDERFIRGFNTRRANFRSYGDNLRNFKPNNPFESASGFSQNIPYVQRQYKNNFLANYALNTAKPFFSGIGDDIGPGLSNLKKGNTFQGRLQVLRGVSKVAVPFTKKDYQVSNLIASLPTPKPSILSPRPGGDVQSPDKARRLAAGLMRGIGLDDQIASNVPRREGIKFNAPLVGDVSIDPITDIGKTVGFVRSPLNQNIFKLTETVLPAKLFETPIKQWLATTAARGGLEGLLLGGADIPEGASESEKVKFLGGQIISGAGNEIIGRGILDTLGKSMSPFFKQIEEGVEVNHQYLRDNLGRFAKENNITPKQAKKLINDFSDWYNKPIKVTDMNGKVTYISRGEAGFAKLGSEPPSPTGKVAQPPKGDIKIKPSEGVEVKEKIPGFIEELGVSPGKPLPKNLPDMAVEEQRILEAEVKTNMNGRGGVGGFVDNLKSDWEDFVNQRSSGRVKGYVAKQDFTKFDDRGVQGIIDFQENKLKYSKLRKFFNDRFSRVKSNGIPINYQRDYLTQIWQEPEAVVREKLGKSIGLRPGFTIEKLIESYREGIKVGLTPKFTKLSDIAGWYEERVTKALADKDFFTSLIKNNYLLPSNKAPRGWITLNPDRFPKFSAVTKDGIYKGTYSAPPELAKVINNYLNTPEGALASFANFASRAKNIVLSGGIPKTGFNAHGINILARNVMASNNPASGLFTGLKYLTSPGSAEKVLLSDPKRLVKAVESGLVFDVQEREFGKIIKDTIIDKVLGKYSETQQKLFEEPLFNKVIPTLKVTHWEEVTKELAKSMPLKEAQKEAARQVNIMFGGINYDAIGRSKETQNIFRSIFLAPDWAESNIKLGGNIVKGIFKPGNKQYRAYLGVATNLGLAFLAANITNKLISGHWTWENDPGHTFEIEIGYTADGKKRYLKPFGTAADFIRVPYDVALSVAKGDFSSIARVFTNRLSTPLSAILQVGTDTDYLGKPIGIRGKDKYGNEMSASQRIGGITNLALGVTTPNYARALIDVATGRSNVEQGIAQALELPLRYSGGSYNKTQKLVDEVAKNEGITGKRLYDLRSGVRGVTFGKNQQGFIRQEGTRALSDLLEEKNLSAKTEESLLSSNKKSLFDGGVMYFKQDNGDIKTIDLSTIQSLPANSNFERAKKNEEVAKVVGEVAKSSLSDQEKETIYKKLGIPKPSADYYSVSKESTEVRYGFVLDAVQKATDRKQMMNLLIQYRSEVFGKRILTDNLVDQLYEEGLIGPNERRILKKYKYDAKTGKLSGSSGSRSSNLTALKKLLSAYVSIANDLSTKNRKTLASLSNNASSRKIPTPSLQNIPRLNTERQTLASFYTQR